MVEKSTPNFQSGFVFIPILVLIFSTVVVGGVVGVAKFTQIDKQIKETDANVVQNLSQLHRVNQANRALKEKIIQFSKLGVQVEEAATVSAKLAELILAKDFGTAQILLSELDGKLEQALAAKKEAERKAAIQDRDKLEAKVIELKKKGVNVAEVDSKLPEVRGLVDSGEYGLVRDKIETLSARLDQLLTLKLEEERKAAETAKVAAVSQNVGGLQYQRKTVQTLRGNFIVDVLTINLGEIRVITDTANSNDCDNNCPTKPLAAYVVENGGVAGINGTYFCPPDYAQCAGKMASFDFPVYNTKLGKFINAKTLFWSGRAMIAFDTAGNAHFFREANSFGGINIAAAIVNYPALVAGGQIVVDELGLPDNLGKVKGNRGALGFSQNTLLAVIGRGATVVDMAHVLKALGAEAGMNLDGGGSSALYFNGSYKVGPGRNLPNAVIFAR